MSENTRVLLSRLFAECFESGNFVSPRTAMKCVDIVYGAAMSRGSSVIEPCDFSALVNVAGLSHIARKFQDNIDRHVEEEKARQVLTDCAAAIKEELTKINNGLVTKVIEWCMSSRRLINIKTTLSNISVPDSLYGERSEMMAKIDEQATKCLFAARDAIRLPQ